MSELSEEKYFSIYSNCILVKGYKQSLIYDLQMGRAKVIPNILYDLLIEFPRNIVKEIISKNEDNKKGIEKYLRLLVEENYAFYSDDLSGLNHIDYKYDNISIINNAILELDISFSYYNHNLISYLEKIGIIALQIRAKENLDEDKIFHFLSEMKDTTIEYIEVCIKYQNKKFLDKITNLVNSNKRFRNIYIHSSFENKEVEKQSKSMGNIFLTKKKLISMNHEMDISVNDFRCNYELFSESQKHNTYFNNKLYIGSSGEIKNAPESEIGFGYIQDLKDVEELKEIISKSEFQKYWFIYKDLCDVCRDCEFKHMCVDNRLPYQREDGTWYYKKECNYNPYIGKWQDEKEYKTLEECGIIVNEKGYNQDQKKVAMINNEELIKPYK